MYNTMKTESNKIKRCDPVKGHTFFYYYFVLHGIYHISNQLDRFHIYFTEGEVFF